MGLFDNFFSPNQQYGIESVTLTGQKVKSKSEKTIADYFTKNGIRYQYEKPAESHFWIFSNRISKPDFYLPDYNVYVEFWGLLDADKKRVSRQYEREMKWKMVMYHKHHIKFISLYPSNLSNLDWIFKKKLKNACGVFLSPTKSDHKVELNSSYDTVEQGRKASSKVSFCRHCGVKVNPNDAFCYNCGGSLEAAK